MSLKFGIYLVEQRIISPEQFCGLVKIQQEALASLASVAIRRNMMTIKQVATVLDAQEITPGKSFIQLAIESDFLDRADAEELIKEQQTTSPTIRSLVQECGLLTQQQCNVLFQHYLKIGTRPMATGTTTGAAKATSTGDQSSQFATTTDQGTTTGGPRAPKFKQKPMIVSQYTSPAGG